MIIKIVAVAAAGLLCLVSGATAQEVHKRNNGIYAAEQIQLVKAAKPGATVQIFSAAGLSGEIEITARQSDTVEVAFVKVAKAGSKSQAIDFIDLISVDLGGRPEAPIIKLRAPNPAPWSGTNFSGRVEVTIFVPLDCEIEISAPSYDVKAEGPFRSLEIPESMGKLEISRVNERLKVATVNRRVVLDDITGNILASTTNSSLIATNLESLSDQARFKNEGGDIRINGMVGSLNIRNSYGRVTVESFTPRGEGSYIRGSSGPIFVELIAMEEGQLVVSNRQEDIELSVPDSLAAYYTLSVDEEGLIEVTNLTFQADLVQRNRLNLQAGESEVDIRSSIKGLGNIYVRGRSGDNDD